MVEAFAHLVLSPSHLSSLKQRLAKILVLKEHVNDTIHTFEAYAQAGGRLTSALLRLADSFECYNEFQKDSSFRSIHSVLCSCQATLHDHYEKIHEFVVRPLTEFLQKDIGRAEDNSRHAAHNFDNYMRAADLYVSASQRKRTESDAEREAHLTATHWTAAEAHLNFERSLIQVERKTLLEVSTNFLMFVNLSGVTFKQCHFYVDSAAENFTQLQIAIPASLGAIRQFAANAEAQQSSLKACHETFWTRLSKPFPGTTSLQHEGYLWKKGGGFTHSWKRRFFRVKDHQMFYEEVADARRGALDLLTTSVKPITDPDRRHCFTVLSPIRKKTYILQAITSWDMEEWMAVIRNNVGYLLDHTSVMKSSDNELETIVDPREQNRFCADCGAPDPSWCCINWATCICIKCSGVHREMSIEVSKVRSLTLDHLDSNILSLFALIGNERANAILTEELPDDLRINEGTDRADRDAFLRRKYEKCEFVNITEPVDVSTAIQNGDALSAFKGICQMKKLASIDNNLLKLAAGLGNVSLCLLVGLNTPRLDLLDDGGWSALSYAAYFGNIRAAEALMAIGCRVESAPEAHPYAIAIAKSHTDMASLFLPYWNGQIDPEKTFQPPLSFDQEGSRDPFLISAEPHDEAE